MSKKIFNSSLVFCLVLSLGVFSFELVLAGGGGNNNDSGSGGGGNWRDSVSGGYNDSLEGNGSDGYDVNTAPGAYNNPVPGTLAGLDNIQVNAYGERVGFDSNTGQWVSEASGGSGGNGGGGRSVCAGTANETCYGWSAWSPCSSTACGVVGIQSRSQSCQCIYVDEWGGSSVGPMYTVTETINCTGPDCSGTGRCATEAEQTYSCSAGNVFNIYSDWYDDFCVNGSCIYSITIPNYCNSSENCGTERCTDSSVWRERCKDGDVYEFQWGKDDSCSATSAGCDDNVYHECPNSERLKEDCEAETVCKMTSSIDAECAIKSTEWTED